MKQRTWRHSLICTKLHKWVCFRSVIFPLHYTNSKRKRRFLMWVQELCVLAGQQWRTKFLNCVLQSQTLPHWCFPMCCNMLLVLSAWNITPASQLLCNLIDVKMVSQEQYLVSLPQELSKVTILFLICGEKRNIFFWPGYNHTVHYNQIYIDIFKWKSHTLENIIL